MVDQANVDAAYRDQADRRVDPGSRKPEARSAVPEEGPHLCFKLNRQYNRDAAVGGNDARYVNHSCTPNCYTQVDGDEIWIIAAKNIRKGEELTYNYLTDGVGSIQCKCRPRCKTLL